MVSTGTDRMGHVVAALRARQVRESTHLPTTLHVAINIKEDGHVHRLSEETLKLPRERRRTHCGWRTGAVGANVYFSSTCVWPPPWVSTQTRLCSKCFPRTEPPATALEDDPIED